MTANDKSPVERDRLITGLMARGISRHQAEAEHAEIEREIAHLRRPEVMRQRRVFWAVFGPRAPERRRPRFSATILATVAAKTEGTCFYCGVALVTLTNHPHQRTVDHYVPLARGGENHPSNLVPACRQCNALKRDKEPESFLATTAGGGA